MLLTLRSRTIRYDALFIKMYSILSQILVSHFCFFPPTYNRKKLDMVRSMMDCLLAKCVPCITDCVMGELEKLGGKYKIALRLAKDPRFERIPCSDCKKCYADDCLTNMVTRHRCFIVATCDKELRGRIRKIPGVPCMYISGYRYTVERMPEG